MLGDTAPKRQRLVVDGLALITFISLALSAWALYSRFGDGTTFRDEQARTWHVVICTIEQAVVATKRPDADKRQALRFYDNLLVNSVHAAPCRIQITRR